MARNFHGLQFCIHVYNRNRMYVRCVEHNELKWFMKESSCFFKLTAPWRANRDSRIHGTRTPGENIAFPVWPKINSLSQIFRYGRSIFCLPHRPKFSDFFDICLHWMSVVRGSAWTWFKTCVYECVQYSKIETNGYCFNFFHPLYSNEWDDFNFDIAIA